MRKEAVVYSIKPGDVIVEERLRYTFDKKAMEELCDSIRDKGQLQPGVCRIEEGKVILVAGERRRQACEIIGCDYAYTIDSETDPLRLLEIEIDENKRRLNLTWQEEVKGIERRHAMLQSIKGVGVPGSRRGHSVKDTAEFHGEGETKIRDDLELAAFMELPEVAKAGSKSDAKKIIKRLKETAVRHAALKEAQKTEVKIELPDNASLKDTLTARINLFKDKVIEGVMEEKLSAIEEPFNIVLFDPPWAVDYDPDTPSKNSYNDKLEEIVPKMEGWLKLIYSKMTEHSHLYMFFGITNYDLVYNLLEKVGFTTNRMPIMWIAQGRHRTRNADMWPGRAYEPIAFARKGNKFLIRKGAPDYIITPTPWKSLQQSQKSVKHPDVWIDLLKRSALPGDRILDPMCGSGMVGVACETLRPTHSLDWTMIEERREARDLALANVVRGYSDLVQSGMKEPKDEGDSQGNS